MSADTTLETLAKSLEQRIQEICEQLTPDDALLVSGLLVQNKALTAQVSLQRKRNQDLTTQLNAIETRFSNIHEELWIELENLNLQTSIQLQLHKNSIIHNLERANGILTQENEALKMRNAELDQRILQQDLKLEEQNQRLIQQCNELAEQKQQSIEVRKMIEELQTVNENIKINNVICDVYRYIRDGPISKCAVSANKPREFREKMMSYLVIDDELKEGSVERTTAEALQTESINLITQAGFDWKVVAALYQRSDSRNDDTHQHKLPPGKSVKSPKIQASLKESLKKVHTITEQHDASDIKDDVINLIENLLS